MTPTMNLAGPGHNVRAADGQVDIFLAAKALLYQSLHDAGVAQRKLAKAVQFYLETY